MCRISFHPLSHHSHRVCGDESSLSTRARADKDHTKRFFFWTEDPEFPYERLGNSTNSSVSTTAFLEYILYQKNINVLLRSASAKRANQQFIITNLCNGTCLQPGGFAIKGVVWGGPLWIHLVDFMSLFGKLEPNTF